MKRIRSHLLTPRTTAIVYAAIVLFTSLQQYFLGPHIYAWIPDRTYTSYNNYVIYKQSFYHLLHATNLYTYYLDEYWDLFKYSPTFALLFGLWAWLPDWAGIILWNGLNAAVLWTAIWHLPRIAPHAKAAILYFVAGELVLALQHTQANALMAGLMIWTVICWEKDCAARGGAMLAASVFIKLFGLVVGLVGLCYDDRWRRAAWFVFWAVILLLLPLPVTGGHGLVWQYTNWRHLLATDFGQSTGTSLAGILESWAHWRPPKTGIVVTGALALAAPLVQWARRKEYGFRLLLLASILIWVVIFNHKAESPTYIIAMAGIGIWYFAREIKWWDTILAVVAFAGISLSMSDLVPPGIRSDIVLTYSIKAVPAVLVWFKLVFWDLWHPVRLRT